VVRINQSLWGDEGNNGQYSDEGLSRQPLQGEVLRATLIN